MTFSFNTDQIEEEVEEEFVFRDRVKINPEELRRMKLLFSEKEREKLKNIFNILRTPLGLTNLIEEPQV